ncbi:MAG: hypothetical protein ROY99_10385 [Ignavibacterium sp.]|jgi:hypothetical protein|nr:hypothetical protein [Ignavibacterium sp.]
MAVIDTLKNVIVIVDSIKNNLSIPDTLKINLLESNKTFYEESWFIALIAAAIAALATIIGAIIGQRLQRRTLKEIYNEQGYLNRDKELFTMRMNGCLQIAEAMSVLYHVTLYKKDGNNLPVLPTSYITYQNLKDWNTDTTKLVDRKLLLLNQEIYSKFTDVNQMVLDHLKEIEESQKPQHEWDKFCREIGRRECGFIQEKQSTVVKAMRDFIKAEYNIDLEEVR